MATPKVFISSTCYDLMQIRDSLFEFVSSYFYEPILSEKGDVFYHPDLHTQESCINELENCQLFILIIGGRFGGSYKLDPKKSVTNAEYEAARLKKIPVFTFIKRDVYEDHRVYQKNKHNKGIVEKIVFPSVEKQEYAIKIFEFIDAVRLSDVNNCYTPFEFVNQIKTQLGKQWAGLMFNFLNNRVKNIDQKIVNQTLDNLTLINRKTEELVENIYKQLKPKEAQEEIASTDRIINGSKFYSRVFRLFSIKKFSSAIDLISKINPKKYKWYEYLVETKEFITIESSELTFGIDKYKDVNLWLKIKIKECYWPAEYEVAPYDSDIIEAIVQYEHLKHLDQEQRFKALEIATNNIA